MAKPEKYDKESPHYWRKNEYGLCAQRGYWLISDKEHKRICNGVGSRVGWWAKLTYHFIPNTNWFMDITPASDIHDYDYCYPDTFKDALAAETAKSMADSRFKVNCNILVDHHGGSEWIRSLRRIRIEKYYLVLRQCGESSFKNGKTILH